MVVGIKHTRSATSTVIVMGAPFPAACTLNSEYGRSVMVARRKTIVSAASEGMSSAISFGVFCPAWPPSTIAIIRSRKVSPGFVVMRMMIQSERTRVPPVTALRSPPLSRMTGALSPVMALSSTEATPSTISPSPGTGSPASTRTKSPFRSRDAITGLGLAPRRGSEICLAWMSFRDFRSVSACAFPRPSAIASAKFANSTVNQSQREIARMKPGRASPRPTSDWIQRAVVKTLPTSTTNMTGLRAMCRGSSLRNESTMARLTIARSRGDAPRHVHRARDGPLRRLGCGDARRRQRRGSCTFDAWRRPQLHVLCDCFGAHRFVLTSARAAARRSVPRRGPE